ncbi:MAG: hypothetical protein IKW74_01945, partial [Thermoguttaceae bacterium]|nr:hypothetical protein [Thermoguttaceae bacterium]
GRGGRMTCGCGKDRSAVQVRSSGCRFCCPTAVWWRPNVSCYAWRCYNPLMLSDPPEWAYGNTRKATVGDVPFGAIIEGADYILVRSCFCQRGRCKHFMTREKPSDD